MRFLFGFMCVLALGVMGCGETTGTGGVGGDGGQGGVGGTAGNGGQGGVGGGVAACVDNVCPCTEAGIRAAIAEGGGPFTFECDGPTTVVTEDEIIIDNDVILDGEGNLTVDAGGMHRVFSVLEGVTAELDGFGVTGGRVESAAGGGIANTRGTLTLTNSTVFGNTSRCIGGGIYNNGGTLALTNSTVSGNVDENIVPAKDVVCGGGGIANWVGTLTVTNSTVSGNTYGGIDHVFGMAAVVSSTVSDNTVYSINVVLAELDGEPAVLALANSLVDGEECLGRGVTSLGYNIESPGDTCGFDQGTDLVNITEGQLNLEPLQDNGGPTMTHALGAGSVAIDHIPAVDCEVDEDQRGVERPKGDACDVGAVEMEVAP